MRVLLSRGNREAGVYRVQNLLGAEPIRLQRNSVCKDPLFCGIPLSDQQLFGHVYHVLSRYGVEFASGHSRSDILCPGSWFEALPSDKWGPAQPIPTNGVPVKAVARPPSAPSSCGTTTPPSGTATPPSGNCPTTIASIGPASCGPIPGVQNIVDCQLQGVVRVAYRNAPD